MSAKDCSEYNSFQKEILPTQKDNKYASIDNNSYGTNVSIKSNHLWNDDGQSNEHSTASI